MKLWVLGPVFVFVRRLLFVDAPKKIRPLFVCSNICCLFILISSIVDAAAARLTLGVTIRK